MPCWYLTPLGENVACAPRTDQILSFLSLLWQTGHNCSKSKQVPNTFLSKLI